MGRAFFVILQTTRVGHTSGPCVLSTDLVSGPRVETDFRRLVDEVEWRRPSSTACLVIQKSFISKSRCDRHEDREEVAKV